MTLEWPPDYRGGHELSVEYSQASVGGLGAKLALVLSFVNTCENADKYLGN